jgi:hypothetical protein
MAGFRRSLGIRHQAEACPSRQAGFFGKVTRSEIIPAFYDFKALMRSPTSR